MEMPTARLQTLVRIYSQYTVPAALIHCLVISLDSEATGMERSVRRR
jgi:hypothetical protein